MEDGLLWLLLLLWPVATGCGEGEVVDLLIKEAESQCEF